MNLKIFNFLQKSILWNNGTLRALWLAQAVSTLGDQVYRVALVYVAYQLGGAKMLGTVFLFQTLALLLFVLLGGSIATRIDPRKLLILSDTFRAIAVTIVGFLLFERWANATALSVLGVAFGIGDALFRPSYSLLFKSVVEPESYAEGIASVTIGRQMFNLLGPLVGSFIVSHFNYGVSFWVDALTFLFSAVCILVVRRLYQQPLTNQQAGPDTPKTTVRQEVLELLREIVSGFRYIKRQRWLLLGLSLTTIAVPVQQSLSSIAIPTYILGISKDANSYSMVLSAYALGAFVGSAIFVFLRKRKNTASQSFALLMACYLIYGLSGFMTHVLPIVCFSFLIGMTMQAYSISWESCIMVRVDRAHIAQTSSVYMFSYTAMIPVGVTVMTSLIAHFGIKISIIAAPWFVAALTLIVLLLLLKDEQKSGVRKNQNALS